MPRKPVPQTSNVFKTSPNPSPSTRPPDHASAQPVSPSRIEWANRWVGIWINGIYPFHHYHARSHEVLGLAAGRARVQFGGPRGPELDFAPGDVIVIPAGVGHCRKSPASGLVVVGAYPEGQESWDLKRETEAEYRQALGEIPNVALPRGDPVYEAGGPLLALWR